MPISAGPIGIVWAGEYDADRQYHYLNVVSNGDCYYLYVAIAPSTGEPLPLSPEMETPHWRLFARPGIPGSAGPIGPQGPKGEPGTMSVDELKEMLGITPGPVIHCGTQAITLAGNASATTFTVYYPEPYKAAPSVMLQLQLSTQYNVVTYGVSYISATFFQFQISNGNATQKTCTMHWMAIGAP